MALSPPKQRNSQSGHEQLRADDTLFVELKDEIWRDQDVVGLTLIELRHALRKLISISSIHNNHLDSQSRRKPLQQAQALTIGTRLSGPMRLLGCGEYGRGLLAHDGDLAP